MLGAFQRHETSLILRIPRTEFQMPWLLFTLAFLSCFIWTLGEHAAYWLDIDAVALTGHRALFGVIYSCIIVAFPLFLGRR